MRPGTPSPSRPALALLGLALLAGCLADPSPAGGNEDASGPATRSKPATETSPILSCTRIWSEALADSSWDCPDPKPPSPGRKD